MGVVLGSSFPTSSIPFFLFLLLYRLMSFPSPPRTWKRKEKKGESVWTDPMMALGWAHNVISEEEIKALSLVPSH